MNLSTSFTRSSPEIRLGSKLSHRCLVKIVGRENVMAGTDCGFAQSPFAKRVHESIMWAKLRALSEGARLASNELWARRTAA
jgi:5-methyltetrahydropteroyltriglutamate--homocysteine methyltransferase